MTINKTNIITAVILILTCMFIGGVIGWKIKPCPTCIGTVTVSVSDSTAPAKDTGVVSVNSIPTKIGTKKYKSSPEASRKNGTLAGDISKVGAKKYNNAPGGPGPECSCYLDTNIFKLDTSVVDNFKASVTATVTGNEIIGMHVDFQNFKPEKWKVLNTQITVGKKQALIKVFPELYARANFNAITATGGGAGGGASFVVKDKHMLGLDAGANFGIGQPISGEVMLRYGFKIHLK